MAPYSDLLGVTSRDLSLLFYFFLFLVSSFYLTSSYLTYSGIYLHFK